MMKIFPYIDAHDLLDSESIGCACGCGEEGDEYKRGFADGVSL